jgi:flagellar biosynthesis anti-sigma factor FlgM
VRLQPETPQAPSNNNFKHRKSIVYKASTNRLKTLSGNADSSNVETGEVAMKIEGINPAATQLPVESVTTRVASGRQAGTQGVAQDWTSFHSDSSSVLSLTSQALNAPEVRQGTVDVLRQSVNSGQYQVDATRIASAISNSGGGKTGT